MTHSEKLAIIAVTIALTSAMLATVMSLAYALWRSAVLPFTTFVLVMVFAQSASAEDRGRIEIANLAAGVTYIGLASADAVITYRSVSDGRAREANPLLVPFVESHGIGRTMGAKLAVNIGMELGLRYIERRWPESRKSVLLARIAAVGVQGFVVAHNLRVLRGVR